MMMRGKISPRKNAKFLISWIIPLPFVVWPGLAPLPSLFYFALALVWGEEEGGGKGEIRADDSEKKEEREWAKKFLHITYFFN